MKNVIIHAGPGKTGSSAIQSMLLQNISALEQQGIMYPQHAIDKNSVSSGNFKEFLVKDGTSYIIDNKKLDILLDKFKKSDKHTLLLSSEFFFQLIPQLKKLIPEASFIVYLRDSLSVLESGYNQSVKRANNTNPLKTQNRNFTSQIDFLDNLISRDNTTNIIIRPYSKNLFHQHNLLDDFAKTVGFTIQHQDSRVINPSYSFEALEFKREANKYPLGSLTHDLDKALQSYSGGIRKYSLIPSEEYLTLKSDLIKKISLFIKKHKIVSLNNFPEELQNQAQNPYLPQQPAEEQFKAIADYIEQEHPLLNSKLKAKISQSPLPEKADPVFLRIISDNASPKAQFDVEGIKAVVDGFNDKGKLGYFKFCRELALLMEDNNLYDSAAFFMESAHQFKPDAPFVNKKLSFYRSLKK